MGKRLPRGAAKEDLYFLVRKHKIPVVVFNVILAELAKRYDGTEFDGLAMAPTPKDRGGKLSRMINLSVRGWSWERIAKEHRLPAVEVEQSVTAALAKERKHYEARVGEQIAHRTILKYLGRNPRGQHLWLMGCRCGARSRTILSNIQKTQRCHACPKVGAPFSGATAIRKTRQKNQGYYFYELIRKRAEVRRGLVAFDLCPSDIKVPTVCPMRGSPLVMGNRKRGPDSPTPVRIDLDRGWVPGNVLVLSWAAAEVLDTVDMAYELHPLPPVRGVPVSSPSAEALCLAIERRLDESWSEPRNMNTTLKFLSQCPV